MADTLFPSILPGEERDIVTDVDDPEIALENGSCPWCPDYEGEYPERHARKAHPDEWAEYKDEDA